MRVLIKSRDDCKFCNNAKLFLKALDIKYIEEHKAIGIVPQIYFGDKYIGGYQDMVELYATKEWDELLEGKL